MVRRLAAMGQEPLGERSQARPAGSQLAAIDLFAGPGGLSLGLTQAGFKVLAAVEIDALACETYRANHPQTCLFETDIRRIEPQAVLDAIGLRPGELDLLGACPPCQGFSTLRSRNGSQAVDDDRNRLLFDVLTFVKEIRPRCVLMENVPGIVRDRRLIYVYRALESYGYQISRRDDVLDVADYGVPQRRRRFVLIASRYGVVDRPEPPGTAATVRQAIESLPPAGTSGDPLHDLPERHGETVQKLITGIPRDGGSRSQLGASAQLGCHQRTDGFYDIYGRMSWDSPAPTITTGCYHPSKGRFLHPAEDRAITMREAATLQGFPIDYWFSMKRGKQGLAQMIGNAMPPAFVASHAAAIRQHLMTADRGVLS
jgi:DNA (cytosine-5)-methyltransferase 1